ncbi:MAG: GNAT family N-acetyltransferase [Acidobacteriota bacterium]
MRLTAERLRFRRPVPEDAEAIFRAYAGDPEVTRYLAWPCHQSVEDTRGFIAWSDSEWAKWPAGPLLIEEKGDGRLLGGTGLAFESATSASTGYVLAREAWGRGFATEALGAMTSLAESLGVTRLFALCHPQHDASARVLEKAGFHLNASFIPASFPNLDEVAPSEAVMYLYPPNVSVEPIADMTDVHECARMMAASEPWITLQRTAETLVPVISDPVKEVHVVRDADGIAAFIILDLRGLTNGYVQTICVRADRRGGGLGAALLGWAEIHVQQQSPNVFLCVSSFNAGAQKFYARLGYERVGVLRQYVVRDADEILMRKTIAPLRGFRK